VPTSDIIICTVRDRAYILFVKKFVLLKSSSENDKKLKILAFDILYFLEIVSRNFLFKFFS